jgi:hypothetical protein
MAAGVEMIYWSPAAPTGKVGLQGFQWALGLLYVALGPPILGLRFWGQGVAAVGPSVAAFFASLTPLLKAVV